MKKSQAATEYIMVWGVIIVSILTIFASLNYIGVFNLEMILPDKCVILSGMSCLGMQLENTSLSLVLRNELGYPISNITLAVNGTGCISYANITEFGNKEALQNGETSTYLVECQSPERMFSAKMKINYVNTLTNEKHKKTGYIKYKQI